MATGKLRDGSLIEISRPRIPTYEVAVDEARTLVDYEHAWSGLSDEYEERPLTSVYPADEYARLEEAIDPDQDFGDLVVPVVVCAVPPVTRREKDS